jgi:hypothetical protein
VYTCWEPFESRSWYRDEPRNDDGRRSTWRPNFCTTCRKRQRSLQPHRMGPSPISRYAISCLQSTLHCRYSQKGGGWWWWTRKDTTLHWNLNVTNANHTSVPVRRTLELALSLMTSIDVEEITDLILFRVPTAAAATPQTFGSLSVEYNAKHE